MTIELRESTTTAPVKKGNRWRTIVATPGQGSSGYYSEEVLKRDAEKIVPPGGQSFINHDISRNPKDLIGVFPEGSYWSDEDNAVVADLEVFSHWRDFVSEVAPHVGMSIFALGEADEDGNVTAIIEDVLNGCDLVARPGLKGSKLDKLYETAVAGTDRHPGARQEEQKKETGMDQEIKDALKGISDTLASLVAEKNTAEKAAAQVEADSAAVTSAVEAYDQAVKAIDDADLLDVQVEALRALAREGRDISAEIAAAKVIKEAAIEAAKAKVDEDAGTGRIVTESAEFKIGAWK